MSLLDELVGLPADRKRGHQKRKQDRFPCGRSFFKMFKDSLTWLRVLAARISTSPKITTFDVNVGLFGDFKRFSCPILFCFFFGGAAPVPYRFLCLRAFLSSLDLPQVYFFFEVLNPPFNLRRSLHEHDEIKNTHTHTHADSDDLACELLPDRFLNEEPVLHLNEDSPR